jgi:hypothetical protein
MQSYERVQRGYTWRETFSDNDSEDFRLLLIRRKRVVGDDPTLDAEERAHGRLVDMGVFLLELVRQTEGDDGETRFVTFGIIMAEVALTGTFVMNLREAEVILLN